MNSFHLVASNLQIGTWNLTKGAVLFRNVLRNIENPLPGGILEGRKLRVVVIEVRFFIKKSGSNIAILCCNCNPSQCTFSDVYSKWL